MLKVIVNTFVVFLLIAGIFLFGVLIGMTFSYDNSDFKRCMEEYYHLQEKYDRSRTL